LVDVDGFINKTKFEEFVSNFLGFLQILLIAEFLGLVEDFEVVFIVGHVIDLSF
jgi:hypothetical protein